MKRSANKQNMGFVKTLLIGLIVGALLAVGGGILIVEKFGSEEVKSKMHYFFHEIKERVGIVKPKLLNKVKNLEDVETGNENNEVSFTIDMNNVIAEINPMIYGSNLSPKAEFEMDIANFGKDIGITNFRFPGGGSMGYSWKEGAFDFEDRFDDAPLSEIDNVIKFCKIAGAGLVIQVNVESGTPEEAADWVRYMNVEKNFRVDYWQLGNEVYGDWDEAHMTGEDYVKLIKQYVPKMKAVDPKIKVGANWGGVKYHEFDKTIMKEAADLIDFVSYHWYPNHINRDHHYQERKHPYPKEVMANGLAVGKLVKRFNDMVNEYAPHRKGLIEFTVMEWDGSWDGVPSDINYDFRGMMWSLANGIFYADALGQFATHGITVANNYAFQEVSFGMIRGWDIEAGWGGSPWDRETIRPKALAFKLYARHFGDLLVESQLTGSPAYKKEADWRPDSFVGNVPYVTGYASTFSRSPYLSIVLINKHEGRNFKVNISVANTRLQNQGDVWILTGPDLSAQNDGSPGVVNIKKFGINGTSNRFKFTAPARSVSLIKIPHYRLDELNPRIVNDEVDDRQLRIQNYERPN